jgi:hypothetical protein
MQSQYHIPINYVEFDENIVTVSKNINGQKLIEIDQ